MKPNGVILWRGASLLDGSPIVAIATGLNSKSSNRKTGAMVQTYILRSDVDPIAAIRTGQDASICGDCRHRGKAGHERTCYVNVGQGPLGVYRAFKRGRYPDMLNYYGTRWTHNPLTDYNAARFVGAGRTVRLGTYGDPAAVPAHIWRALTVNSTGHTGYTHQWRKFPALRALCMASCDSALEAREARNLGWRTFRVGLYPESRLTALESLCPASAEAGKKLTCAQCLACGGADGRKGSIYIPAHGGFAVMANVRKFAGIPILQA